VTTAIDTSALWAISRQEPTASEWSRILTEAAAEGRLIISPVAFAEFARAAPDAASLIAILDRMQISFDSISPEAAYRAGTAFRLYRSAGGPREHLLPDFLIAGHALVQADRLASNDRGYLRKWFPDLVLIRP
jgi:predicted nucleic acid-binding protein